jgi:hypothetical protein
MRAFSHWRSLVSVLGTATLHPEEVHYKGLDSFTGYQAYAVSKLGNIIHANLLAKKFEESGTPYTANSVNPGSCVSFAPLFLVDQCFSSTVFVPPQASWSTRSCMTEPFSSTMEQSCSESSTYQRLRNKLPPRLFMLPQILNWRRRTASTLKTLRFARLVQQDQSLVRKYLILLLFLLART